MPPPVATDVPRLTRDVAKSTLSRAVSLVFSETVKLEISETAEITTPSAPWIVGAIGFSGSFSGLVYVRLLEAYATRVTSRVLGLASSEFIVHGPDMVKDTIGEVTNIIVGAFKTALAEKGHKFKMTVPTIIRGTDFKILPVTHTDHLTIYFESEGQPVIVDLQMSVNRASAR